MKTRTLDVTVEVRKTERVTIEVPAFLDPRGSEVLHTAAHKLGMDVKGGATLYSVVDVTPKPRTAKQRVNQAFKTLRKAGVVARMNYQCCSSCGWEALESDYPNFNDNTDTAVFYHRQDAESFDERGNLRKANYWNSHNELVERTVDLYLAWMGNAEMIVYALSNEGLEIKWDGSNNKRIAVTGVKEEVL